MEEQDYVCGQEYREYRPLVPDGIYEAQCLSYEPMTYVTQTDKGPRNISKLILKFSLVNVPDETSQDKNVELFMSLNMPWDGHISVGSKYFKSWVKINGNKLPSRNAKMSPRLFLNKLCKVKTRTVKPKDGGEELPECFHYSIVDTIMEVL